MTKILLIFLITFSSNLISQEIDDFFVETDGAVNDIDSDGNYIYFAGEFTKVNKYSGCGVVVSNEAIEVDYNNKYKIYGTVYDALSDGEGGWYIVGDFTRIGKHSVGRFAHIFSDGSLDTTFLPFFKKNIFKIRSYKNELFLITGNIESLGGGVIKLNLLTQEITNLYFNFNSIYDLAFDDKFYYLCATTHPEPGDNAPQPLVCRVFKESGKIDNDFFISEEDSKLCYLNDNYFYIFSGYSNYMLKRINTITGKIDENWMFRIGDKILDMKFDDKFLYASGNFKYINNDNYSGFFRINLETFKIDEECLNLDLGDTKSIDIDENYIYLSGYSNGNVYKIEKSTLKIDNKFNLINKTDNFFNVIKVSNNNIFLGGGFSTFGLGHSCDNIFRFDKNKNEVDTDFRVSIDGTVYKIKVIKNKVYLNGFFNTINNVEVNKLASIDLDNLEINNILSENLNYNGYFTNFESDGKHLYIGGNFEIENKLKNLARINQIDDSFDFSWVPNPNRIVNTLKFEDGELYVGGNFDSIYNYNIYYLAKLDIKNSQLLKDFDLSFVFDSTFGNNQGVNFIESNNKNLFISARLKNNNNFFINGIAKISKSDLGISKLNGTTRNLNIFDATYDDEDLYCLGNFDYSYDIRIKGLAKVNILDFSLDERWAPSLDYTAPNFNTIMKVDDYIYICSGFKNISNSKRNKLVRFNDNKIILNTPKLIYPENSSYNISYLNLEFSHVNNAIQYEIKYSYDKEFNDCKFAYTYTNYYLINHNITPSSTLFWKVRAINDFYKSDWSETFSFETRFPGPKIINKPVGGVTSTIYFDYDTCFVEWENLGDDYSYFVTITDYYNQDIKYIDSLKVFDNKYHYEDMKDSSRYNLKVYSLINDRISFDSDANIRTLYKKTPSKISLLKPNNNEEFFNKFNIEFKWKVNRDIDFFHFQVSKDSLFKSIIIDRDSIKVNFKGNQEFRYSTIKFDSNTTYFWRVKAKSILGESEFSDTWKFTTTSPISSVNSSKNVNEYSIFPNPTNTIINIVSNNDAKFDKVEIYNLEGILLLEKNGKFNNLSFDVSNFSKATYILKIYSNNEVITDKFIKN